VVGRASPQRSTTADMIRKPSKADGFGDVRPGGEGAFHPAPCCDGAGAPTRGPRSVQLVAATARLALSSGRVVTSGHVSSISPHSSAVQQGVNQHNRCITGSATSGGTTVHIKCASRIARGV
jgi:hypothetical protein